MMATTAAASRSRYSQVAIVLHWTIALLIIGNLIGGIVLGNDWLTGSLKLTTLGLHQSFGLTILGLSLVRLTWRLTNPPPSLPKDMSAAEHLLAKSTHWLFYGFMILIPLAGWAMSSANPKNFPIPYFWLFNVPHLPVLMSRANSHQYNQIHEYLAYAAIATLALHISGALKHQYIDRDDVLSRMAPWVKRKLAR